MRRSVLLIACALATLRTSAASAQPSTHAALAEELFRAGRALSAQHRYKEACEKLDESQKLDPAVGTLLSLGECYSGQGRAASALLAYRAAAALANSRGDPRGTAAEERAIAIEPQLSKIVIHTGSDPSKEARITINGELFARDVLGAPIPVDAGTVTVAEAAPGFKTWSTKVEVRPFGDTVNVALPALERLSDPDVIARERAGRSRRRTFGLGLGIAGLVTVGVGAILGMQGIIKIRNANRACPGGNVCIDAGAVSENKLGRSFADASTVLLPVGAALAGMGTFLYLTARPPSVPGVGADMSSSSARVRVGWSW